MFYRLFKKLKKQALSCTDLTQGHMLSCSFRLFYNEDNNTVQLIDRHNKEIIAQTNNFNITRILIKPNYIMQYVSSKLMLLYGVKFQKIQGYPTITRFHSYYIVSKTGKYIYIPRETYVAGGQIVSITSYKEAVIDYKWKLNYTKISKANRAAFTALDNMVPIDDSFLPAKHHRITHNTYESNREDIIINLVLSTPNPDGNDLATLRKLLNFNTQKCNLRKILQELINASRYDRAYKEGAVTITQRQNLVR